MHFEFSCWLFFYACKTFAKLQKFRIMQVIFSHCLEHIICDPGFHLWFICIRLVQHLSYWLVWPALKKNKQPPCFRFWLKCVWVFLLSVVSLFVRLWQENHFSFWLDRLINQSRLDFIWSQYEKNIEKKILRKKFWWTTKTKNL